MQIIIQSLQSNTVFRKTKYFFKKEACLYRSIQSKINEIHRDMDKYQSNLMEKHLTDIECTIDLSGKHFTCKDSGR